MKNNKSKSQIIWSVLIISILVTLTVIYQEKIKNEILIYQSDSYERNVQDEYNLLTSKLYTKEFTHFPITVEEISLPNSFNTGSSDIDFINAKVVIMDRIGHFSILEKNIFRSLGKVPNQIERFEKNYGKTSTNSMRAHSFVVSCEKNALLVYYSAYDTRNSGKLTLAMFPLDCNGKEVINWERGKTLFEVRLTLKQLLQSQAAGGALLWDGDEIFVSVGYAENDEDVLRRVSQNINLPFGKVWRIQIGGIPTVHSIGHRNITGLTKLRNQLIAVEHGPKGGDEINVIELNENYGWPDFSFGQRYNTFEFVSKNLDETHRLPIYTFIPSIAPSDIVTTNIFTEYGPVLAISTLKAQSLYLALFQDNRVLNEQSVYLGSRIRSLTSSEKEIFAITDDSKLLKIGVNSDDQSAGDGLYFKDETLKQCLTCHIINKDLNQRYDKINLYGILTRGFGQQDHIRYSTVLSEHNTKSIDYLTLKKFLNKSDEYRSTTMPRLNLSDDEIQHLFSLLSSY